MASLELLGLDEAGIERLTVLENLTLSCCNLEPSCLLPVTTSLTMLCLDGVALQPRQAQQGGTLGAAQLLHVLARLTALRELPMNDVEGDWPQQQLAPYSALTASSNLQKLRIDDCEIVGAVWPHVFPAGRQLPQLHSFKFYPSCTRPDDDSDDDDEPAAFGCADVTRLVSCCPAVQDLTFTPAADASLAALQFLTALTCLDIGPVKPAAIRSDLTALSQLQELQVSVSLPAAAAAPGAGKDALSGLQHLVPLTVLTAFTGLTWFYRPALCLQLSCTAPTGSLPDVLVQLLEKCAADQAAQPAVISSVVRQLQQQRQQVAQQAAQLQQQQKQLTAAKAESAELRGEVQALQGQLRQEVLAALRKQQQG